MKKVSVVVIISFFLIASWTVVLAAEMAKEGESIIKSASSITHKSITMEKERAEYQWEIHGVVAEANENSPLYNATFYSLGHFHVFKGAYEDRGFTRYTRPDGDHIFATYESKGKVGGERKIKITFVGGTGKCAGITGEGESIWIRGLRPPTKGTSMSLYVGKFKWKIP
jgi:hypothetical protein